MIAHLLLVAVIVLFLDDYDSVAGRHAATLIAGFVFSVVYGLIGAGCWAGSSLMIRHIFRRRRPPSWVVRTAAIDTL